MGIEAHGQDGEDPLVAFEQAQLVEGHVRKVQAVLQGPELVDELVEDGGGLWGRGLPVGIGCVHRLNLRAAVGGYQRGDHVLVRSSLLSHWSRTSSPLAM